MVASVTFASIVFYLGTVGVLARSADTKYVKIADRLTAEYEQGGRPRLLQGIQRLLGDGIDSDTEVYLLIDQGGQVLGGNVSQWSGGWGGDNHFEMRDIVRDGRNSASRLLPRRLSNGDTLIVGWDIADQRAIAALVWKAIGGSVIVSIMLAFAGASIFRGQVEAHLSEIRATARSIVTGDLGSRIALSHRNDEFSRLGSDINTMLDRIQHLMEGTIHVSNAIAHNLRTPFGRLRNRLAQALEADASAESLGESARGAIAAVDDLIAVFEKLLTIAEAESGVHRRSFGPVPLAPLIHEAAELYEAVAAEEGIRLTATVKGEPVTVGDKDLLAVALSNLVDNALKYAGPGKRVDVSAAEIEGKVVMKVTDDGPGIPEAERAKVTRRFYRMEATRGQPGSGLGLSMVAAIASLHGGSLSFEDGRPGLVAGLELPRAPETF